MPLAKTTSKISIEDYLEGEELGETRHEYIYGEIYAMAGGSARYNRIVNNTGFQIDSRLQNSRCETYTENVKLKADDETFYYPDVMVACDENPASDFYRKEPIPLVGVLSSSAARIDRNEKLIVYKSIPTLREYLIVSQERILVEVHRLLENGEWQTEIYSAIGAVIRPDSIEFELPLTEIYRRVDSTARIGEFAQ